MVEVSILVLIVFSFHVINGDGTESSTASNSSQEDPTLDESQPLTISAELSQCGLRITGPGFNWEKIDDCSTEYTDLTERPKIKGEQGLKGFPGVTEIQGLKGEPGLKGVSGPVGPQGPRGSIGVQGPRGLEGGSGEYGLIGHQGIVGERGDQGFKGVKGVRGDKGPLSVGARGPPGKPAPYNVYSHLWHVEPPKYDTKSEVPESEARHRYPGTQLNPAKSCANIEADGTTDGEYYLNPESEFIAKCDFIKKSACLSLIYEEEPTLSKTKPCWLFQDGFSIGKFYNNQLQNIKYLSTLNGTTHSTHKISITCNYLKLSEDSNLKIQLYHMLLIGTEATDETPLYYKVNTDECTDGVGFAEIEITINGPFLPITDFYIQDYGEESDLIFEKTQVCFYYK